VHPVYDRSVHFARTPKHSAVVFEFGNEDVLHLQVAAGMKQRNSVQKTLDGAGTQMETLVLHAFTNKILDVGRLDTSRQWRIQYALDRNVSLFHSNCVPDGAPEGDALFDSTVMQVLRTDFEQSLNRSLEFRRRNTEFFTNLCDSGSRNIGTAFDKVEV